jgi:hypothetical protein
VLGIYSEAERLAGSQEGLISTGRGYMQHIHVDRMLQKWDVNCQIQWLSIKSHLDGACYNGEVYFDSIEVGKSLARLVINSFSR